MPEVDVGVIVAVLRELYPRELDHAISEARARIAEAKLAAGTVSLDHDEAGDVTVTKRGPDDVEAE